MNSMKSLAMNCGWLANLGNSVDDGVELRKKSVLELLERILITSR
jgi:hypothetical protein